MKPRSPARQALAVAAALAVVCGFLWFRSQAPVMSGTKTFSFGGVGAAPAGGAGGPTRATTATATAAATTTTPPTAGGR